MDFCQIILVSIPVNNAELIAILKNDAFLFEKYRNIFEHKKTKIFFLDYYVGVSS